MSSIKEQLIAEFERKREEAANMEAGSIKQKTLIDSMIRIADMIREIEKNEAEVELREKAQYDELSIKDREFELKEKSYSDELAYRDQQIAKEFKDRLVNVGVAVGVPMLYISAYLLAYFTSMNFEKSGRLFSTEGGKSSLRNLLNPKK